MVQRRVTELSRRELLQLLASVGAAAALGIPDSERAAATPRRAPEVLRGFPGLAARAAATKPHGSDLGAVEHVVFLMMENRSYDHYFGAYPSGRGFDDHPRHSLGSFEQHYPHGGSLHPRNRLLPFHLTAGHDEDCTNDLTHDWGPMHECWNHGRMDSFVKVHTSARHEGSRGALTMGYYTRQELGFYWSVADHFTLCDAYHSSILGPTHPNRLMANSGSIDPAGRHGGPVTDTSPDPGKRWSCSWPTVQEHLEDAGISWKVYHPSYADLSPKYAHLAAYETWNPVIYDPTANPLVMLASDHVLPYFKAFENPASALYQKAFLPTFPSEFTTDIARGTLPKVSWIIPPLGFDEHPSASPQRGMYFTQLVLDALLANRSVWSKTVLFLMYDENDGWFDHVPPPTAPRGTPGEWLTASSISPNTDGIRGPLGLGVRVPMLVLSPFARGGHVVSHIYDHTSQLKFLHERFGIGVPLVSRWRRRTVGDLAETLFRSRKDVVRPHLPEVALAPPQPTGSCSAVSQDTEQGGAPPVVPKHQRMPTQHGTTIPVPRRRSHRHHASAATAVAPGPAGRRSGPSQSTRKAATAELLEASVNPRAGGV